MIEYLAKKNNVGKWRLQGRYFFILRFWENIWEVKQIN